MLTLVLYHRYRALPLSIISEKGHTTVYKKYLMYMYNYTCMQYTLCELNRWVQMIHVHVCNTECEQMDKEYRLMMKR